MTVNFLTESGDYTVRDFQIDIRENANDGLNNGIYSIGATTDDGNTASDDFLSVQLSRSKHMFVVMKSKLYHQNILMFLNQEHSRTTMPL